MPAKIYNTTPIIEAFIISAKLLTANHPHLSSLQISQLVVTKFNSSQPFVVDIDGRVNTQTFIYNIFINR